MTHDLPIPRQDDRAEGTSVVEWGHEDDESPASGRLRRAFAGLGDDPRVPLLLAGLGAVAALASLLGEWVTIALPPGVGDGVNPLDVSSGVSETGGLGTGYVVGLLLLGSVVALALRGTDAVRANARVLGLALATGLLAVLAAAVVTLDDSRRMPLYSPEDGLKIEYGRGLVMAFGAVLLFTAALVRSSTARSSDQPEARPRRRRPRPDDNELYDDRPPADLTVTPAAPFARETPQHGGLRG